ncbi:MAG TPA: DUF5320 domain-containing protein [Sumerlaeia bacterium]|nr:DUF5320 domain-containing protein [Sumerlaeia bacterium]
MPAGDRTGPMGLGPMTGRAAGYCAGYPIPGFANPAFGRGGFRGGRRGGGGGYGWRNQFYATGLTGWQRAAMGMPGAAFPAPVGPGPVTTKKDQLRALKTQAEYFEDALKGIKERMEQIEESPED